MQNKNETLKLPSSSTQIVIPKTISKAVFSNSDCTVRLFLCRCSEKAQWLWYMINCFCRWYVKLTKVYLFEDFPCVLCIKLIEQKPENESCHLASTLKNDEKYCRTFCLTNLLYSLSKNRAIGKKLLTFKHH